MKSKRFVLTFPSDVTGEPITYNLIKKFDIMVNIVRADVSPGTIGHLVMEMTAPAKVLKEGMTYIRQQNVIVNQLKRRSTTGRTFVFIAVPVHLFVLPMR